MLLVTNSCEPIRWLTIHSCSLITKCHLEEKKTLTRSLSPVCVMNFLTCTSQRRVRGKTRTKTSHGILSGWERFHQIDQKVKWYSLRVGEIPMDGDPKVEIGTKGVIGEQTHAT